jgi:hypothetical protein
VTPLDLVFGSATTVIALALAAAAALAIAAAALDYLSGTTGATPPFTLASERRWLFLAVGLPAVLALFASGTLLAAIGSGSVAPGDGSTALLWLANVAFALAVAVCGVCSPLARNWVWATFAFLAGVAAFLLLLALVAREPSGNEAGLLTGVGPRALFGATVGGIWLIVALCTAALVGVFAYVVERVALLLEARRMPPMSEWRR